MIANTPLLPTTLAEVQDAVRSLSRVVVAGHGTKSALSSGANLSMSRLQGIMEYDPGEFTFTAWAGTPIAEVRTMLAKNGQYLPFDPPMTQLGATLGGTVAAGLSGSGRLRFGGVRDFLLGVRLVSGEGRVVYGGGKVVKNAAGFDIPKLMVGSLGQYGVMVEMTFKVFPQPESFSTVAFDFANTAAAVDGLLAVASSQAEPACLDFEPPYRLWVRLGGMSAAADARIARIQQLLETRHELFRGDEEAALWRGVGEFEWLPKGYRLVKLPLVPQQIVPLENVLGQIGVLVPRRYGVAGNVAWLGWPDDAPESRLGELCEELRRPAVAITGRWERKMWGSDSQHPFANRIRRVFDPENKLS